MKKKHLFVMKKIILRKLENYGDCLGYKGCSKSMQTANEMVMRMNTSQHRGELGKGKMDWVRD